MKANDPRPPYVQVVDHLRRAIESGEFPPGHRLKSGRDLAREYGVALMTMQKALNALAAEGLVVAHQGRGVFVAGGDASDRDSVVTLAALARQVAELQEQLQTVEGRLTRLESPPESNGAG